MVEKYAEILKLLWKDSCTVYQWEKVTDPETHVTDFQETLLLEDEPCKLSFSSLSSTSGDPAAEAPRSITLFLRPDLDIPAGCKIIVTRTDPGTGEETVFTLSNSGRPGRFFSHQEISLEEFRGWA